MLPPPPESSSSSSSRRSLCVCVVGPKGRGTGDPPFPSSLLLSLLPYRSGGSGGGSLSPSCLEGGGKGKGGSVFPFFPASPSPQQCPSPLLRYMLWRRRRTWWRDREGKEGLLSPLPSIPIHLSSLPLSPTFLLLLLLRLSCQKDLSLL